MQEASRIRLGISSFATVRQPLAEVESALAGFGVGVEVICEVPHAWPAPVPWQRGNLLALHVPMLGINIAGTNPGIREESTRQAIAVISEAARINGHPADNALWESPGRKARGAGTHGGG